MIARAFVVLRWICRFIDALDGIAILRRMKTLFMISIFAVGVAVMILAVHFGTVSYDSNRTIQQAINVLAGVLIGKRVSLTSSFRMFTCSAATEIYSCKHIVFSDLASN